MARSSRGLGRKIFFLETEVRILYELRDIKILKFFSCKKAFAVT